MDFATICDWNATKANRSMYKYLFPFTIMDAYSLPFYRYVVALIECPGVQPARLGCRLIFTCYDGTYVQYVPTCVSLCPYLFL